MLEVISNISESLLNIYSEFCKSNENQIYNDLWIFQASKHTNSFIKARPGGFPSIWFPFSIFAFILESLRGRKIITLYIIQIRNFTIKSRILHTDESNGRWSCHVSSFFLTCFFFYFFFSFFRSIHLISNASFF